MNAVKNIVLEVLDRFLTLGNIIERLFKLHMPDMTSYELLNSCQGMVIIMIFINALPVLFIFDAFIQHIRRKRAGVIMKNKCVIDGLVTDIAWKKIGNNSYAKITGDRQASVSYKVNKEPYILKCPAGEILNGDHVRVVYEKNDPEHAMLERDYDEGRRGHIREKILALLGLIVIIISCVSVVIARMAI